MSALPTLLRQRGHEEARVGMVELFFDLVFVFAVTQLSHTLLAHLDAAGTVQVTLLLLAVWWVWIYTSWVTNFLDPERIAVRVLLFVLMLVGRDSSDSLVETLRGQRWAAALAGIGFALLVAIGVGRAFKGITPTNLDAHNSGGRNVNSIAELLFTKYLFAFELTGALLIVAAVGAMVLAHIERDGPRASQKLIAQARIRSGRPQPLPGPGVLASGNSIGTPALLPDGTVSPESVLVTTPGVLELPELPPSEEDL